MTDPQRDAVAVLLAATGDNVTREGLQETPSRVLKAYGEWFSGYKREPDDLFRTFEDGAQNCDELVLVANIEVWSHCEHHMAPFFGLAHVGYIPNGRVLGLSKFARLVDLFARRLQVQERLTNQIADTLLQGLMYDQPFNYEGQKTLRIKPKGVGVVLECRHLCMESRGVRSRGAVTVTSALRGCLKEDGSARSEFLSLVRSASKAKDGL